LLSELFEPIWREVFRPEISLYPHNVLPFLVFGERDVKVLALHDLLFLENGGGMSAGNQYRARKLRHSLDAADVIVTVSETSRKQIAELVGSDKPIFVIFNALAPAFEQVADQRRTRTVKEVCKVLHFGGVAASKNTRLLIHAMGKLKKDGQRFELLLAAMSTHNDIVEKWMNEAALTNDDVKVLPSLPDGELMAIYAEVDAHCMPSRGEGFGIPVIEAARCSVPNVLSPLDVFHELLGNDAIFVGAWTADEIASGISRVVSQDVSDLTRRARSRTDRFLFDSVHSLDAEPAFCAIDEILRRRRSGKKFLPHI
jgi:glycosyltransferase involved in cell wall biosynthesis